MKGEMNRRGFIGAGAMLAVAGEIAERVAGTKITWDPKARRFDNAAANAFLTRDYRKGWEISGLA